jgi:hypothetical protein
MAILRSTLAAGQLYSASSGLSARWASAICPIDSTGSRAGTCRSKHSEQGRADRRPRPRRELYDDQTIAAGLYAEYRRDYELTDEARQRAFDDLNRSFGSGFPDEVPLAKLEEIKAHLGERMVKLNREALADPTAAEPMLDLQHVMDLKIVVEDEIAKYNVN